MREPVRRSGAMALVIGDRARFLAINSRYQVLFAVATAFAWAHTVDEVRIGEMVGVPFAIANTAAVALWSRMRWGSRFALTLAFGVLWTVTAIPYHVLPLINGVVTWQNVSGLSRIGAGLIMAASAVAMFAQRATAHRRR